MGIAKAVALLGVASLLILLLAQWEGSPVSNAWNSLTTTASANPFTDVPSWPVFIPPTSPAQGTSCDWWNVICWTSAAASSIAYATSYIGTSILYGAQVIFVALSNIFAFLKWFFTLLGSFGGAMFAFITAPMSVFSGNNGYFGWLILVPIIVMVLWEFLKLIRGNEF